MLVKDSLQRSTTYMDFYKVLVVGKLLKV